MMDCVSQYFQKKGLHPLTETMGNSDIVLGVKLNWQGSLLTYKVDKDTLMIVCYERIKKKNSGLRSGFKDLISWLKIIQEEVPQIQWVTGRVEALSSSAAVAGLTTEKLNRFYRDIMQTPDALDLGDKWFRFELSTLKNFRFHYRMTMMKQAL